MRKPDHKSNVFHFAGTYGFLAVAGACTLLLSPGCGEENASQVKPAVMGEREAVTVSVAPLLRADWPRTVDVVGTIYGQDEATIAAKVAGRVRSIDADLGDRVAGGAVLAEIDPVDYRIEVERRRNAVTEALSKVGLSELPDDSFDVNRVPTVERAHYQAENAKARFERARRLFDQKPPLISEQDYADLQTAYEVAMRDADVARLEAQTNLATAYSRQSELRAAEQTLADTQIKAPPLSDGQTYAVAQRSASVGEYVSPGSAAFRLVLDRIVKFRGAIPEQHTSDVKVGQKVTLSIAGQSQPAVGKVARVSPAVDVATRTFEIEATFDNADGRLRPGAFVRGVVEIGIDHGVAVVPQAAINSFAGINKLYSIKDGKAVDYTISVRDTQGDNAALVEPLEGVETVITSGGARLARGVPVIVAATQPAAPPATQAVQR